MIPSICYMSSLPNDEIIIQKVKSSLTVKKFSVANPLVVEILDLLDLTVPLYDFNIDLTSWFFVGGDVLIFGIYCKT